MYRIVKSLSVMYICISKSLNIVDLFKFEYSHRGLLEHAFFLSTYSDVQHASLLTFTARQQLKATKSGTGGLASPIAFRYYAFRIPKPTSHCNNAERRFYLGEQRTRYLSAFKCTFLSDIKINWKNIVLSGMSPCGFGRKYRPYFLGENQRTKRRFL
jgi:hypothetical protein